jgi:hypothetical protein
LACSSVLPYERSEHLRSEHLCEVGRLACSSVLPYERSEHLRSEHLCERDADHRVDRLREGRHCGLVDHRLHPGVDLRNLHGVLF